MKNKSAVTLMFAVSTVLAAFAGVVFFNNVAAVACWWSAFIAAAGDTALVPAGCSGFFKWLDWSVVDYSCASTLIPFLGFACISIGLARIRRGGKIDSEFFPFFRAYDQLNIAFGLIGTLWGIIIIGYYKMDTVEMANLMSCLHTALFSTLIAVIWVFVIDHSMLRPLMRRVLESSGYTRPEDADLADIFDRIRRGAAGLEETWNSEKANLELFAASVDAARGEIDRFAETGDAAREMLVNGLSAAVGRFISGLESAAADAEERRKKLDEDLAAGIAASEARREMLDAAAEKRIADAESASAEIAGTVSGMASAVEGVQAAQSRIISMIEDLVKRNGELAEASAREREEADGLRGKVAELNGTLEAKTGELASAVAALKRAGEENEDRIGKLHAEIDAFASAKAAAEAGKDAALRESEMNRSRAARAEGMLEKVKSAFSQQS